MVGCWVTLSVILWSQPAFAVERCGHAIALRCQVSPEMIRGSVSALLQYLGSHILINICHLLCENLDPQVRPEGDKYLTRGAVEA